jgi:hypothetical protein
VLFSLINYARFKNINPENALSKTNKKFIDRFQLMEQLIQEEKQEIESMSLAEMDVYWEKAKAILKKKAHKSTPATVQIVLNAKANHIVRKFYLRTSY